LCGGVGDCTSQIKGTIAIQAIHQILRPGPGIESQTKKTEAAANANAVKSRLGFRVSAALSETSLFRRRFFSFFGFRRLPIALPC
jgi:hypothetical protein